MTPRVRSFAYASLRTLALLSIAALAFSVYGAGGRPLSPGLELDLDGSPSRCHDMARRLLSSDAATWREAEMRLAHAGPGALGAIDVPWLLTDTYGRARVREVVRRSLGRCVTPRELAAHPRLIALVADSIARGFALAPFLAAYGSLPGPDADAMVIDEHPEARSPRPEEQMFALGGCAVPAALSLLHDARPVGRAFGIGMLGGLGAAAMADSVAPLAGDDAAFSVDHGDYFDRETVGHRAKAFVASVNEVPEHRCFTYERDLESDLVNGIRETSAAMQATSWDRWWDEARPAWRDWWRLAGEGLQPPNREEWWNAMFEYRGFRLFRVPNSEPRSTLVVTGPANTHCRIETDSTVVAEGEVPLEYVREQDSVSVARRRARDLRGDYSDRTYIVSAKLPDGRSFRNEFFWSESTRHTVEVLPALKPRRR